MKKEHRKTTGRSAECVAQTIVDEANKKLSQLGYRAELAQTEKEPKIQKPA